MGKRIFSPLLLYFDNVLFLMSVSSAHHGFYKIPVICHEQESFRILIKPSCIGDPYRISNLLRHNLLCMSIPFRTYNPHGLIIRKHNFAVGAGDFLATDAHLIPTGHLNALHGRLSVYRDNTLLDQFIRIPSGAYSAGCQIFILGGGITLSLILKDSGASRVMADGIVWLIEGRNIFLIALIVGVFIVFLTEFTSNTASAALLVPLFISIAESLGVPSLGLALIIAIGASCAFMLPVATPPNAIVFGTGRIKQAEMVKAGIRLNVLCSIAIAIAAYFFWL